MQQYLLSVRCDDEWADGPTAALVTLSPERQSTIKLLYNEYQSLAKRYAPERFSVLEMFAYDCDFFALEELAMHPEFDAISAALEDSEPYSIVLDTASSAAESEEQARVGAFHLNPLAFCSQDYQCLRISSDGISWCVCPRHCALEFYTTMLTIAEVTA